MIREIAAHLIRVTAVHRREKKLSRADIDRSAPRCRATSAQAAT
jgi:hypothetical protein